MPGLLANGHPDLFRPGQDFKLTLRAPRFYDIEPGSPTARLVPATELFVDFEQVYTVADRRVTDRYTAVQFNVEGFELVWTNVMHTQNNRRVTMWATEWPAMPPWFRARCHGGKSKGKGKGGKFRHGKGAP